ncbi:hypothetical protein CW304_31820 [Bacillus sp. UFRGS-B20]|nr:hypothetical protein CW304_31820 [Bacillus sp. UFRGS-B20]
MKNSSIYFLNIFLKIILQIRMLCLFFVILRFNIYCRYGCIKFIVYSIYPNRHFFHSLFTYY